MDGRHHGKAGLPESVVELLGLLEELVLLERRFPRGVAGQVATGREGPAGAVNQNTADLRILLSLLQRPQNLVPGAARPRRDRVELIWAVQQDLGHLAARAVGDLIELHGSSAHPRLSTPSILP